MLNRNDHTTGQRTTYSVGIQFRLRAHALSHYRHAYARPSLKLHDTHINAPAHLMTSINSQRCNSPRMHNQQGVQPRHRLAYHPLLVHQQVRLLHVQDPGTPPLPVPRPARHQIQGTSRHPYRSNTPRRRVQVYSLISPFSPLFGTLPPTVFSLQFPRVNTHRAALNAHYPPITYACKPAYNSS